MLELIMVTILCCMASTAIIYYLVTPGLNYIWDKYKLDDYIDPL